MPTLSPSTRRSQSYSLEQSLCYLVFLVRTSNLHLAAILSKYLHRFKINKNLEGFLKDAPFSIRSILLATLIYFSLPAHYLLVSFTALYYEVLSLVFRYLKSKNADHACEKTLSFIEGITLLYYDYFAWKLFVTFSSVSLSATEGWVLTTLNLSSSLLMVPLILNYTSGVVVALLTSLDYIFHGVQVLYTTMAGPTKINSQSTSLNTQVFY